MIGLLGGTFDPIHIGHLRIALEVLEALELRQMRFIPLRDPPHRGVPEVMPQQRYEMVAAAVADEPRFLVDDCELRREGKSYTADTLSGLRQEIGEVPLFLLLGSDAFRGFPSWHQPEQVLALAHLVVLQRPGEMMPNLYPKRVATSWGDAQSLPGGRILFKSTTQLDISATNIRRMVRAGLSPRYLIPDAVLRYISEHRLYQAKE